jgi:hypothetical protein
MTLSDFICKVLGHRRPLRKFSCCVCPRCWSVVVPKRVRP